MTEETPLPLAVMVTVRALTTLALPEAFKLILPAVPDSGWV